MPVTPFRDWLARYVIVETSEGFVVRFVNTGVELSRWPTRTKAATAKVRLAFDDRKRHEAHDGR